MNIEENEIMKVLARQELSDTRMSLYSQMLKELRECFVNLSAITESEVDKYYFYLKNRKLKQNSRITKWRCFKRACRILDPKIDDRIKFNLWHFKLPKSDIEILTLEEILMMAHAASNIRDKLFLLTIYESGLRPGEIVSLKKQDVEFDEYGAIIHVRIGKTGPRDVRITQTAHYLKNYISLLQGDSLWGIDKFGIIVMLKRLAKKVGITKKVNIKLFRHTRYSHMAPILTDQAAKKHFGWTSDSKMPKIYGHLTQKLIDPQVIEASRKIEIIV